MRTYNLFISHSWNYYNEYCKLVDLLKGIRYFKWKNYSVSPEYPISPDLHISDSQLQNYLENQIKRASCVLIIGGKYINFREWIQTEINISAYFEKPMIGVLPLGTREVPKIFKEICVDIVGWNFNSIASSIKKFSI